MAGQDSLVPLTSERRLTAAAFQTLAEVPAELEWFANIGSAATRRVYQTALSDFMEFLGIAKPEEFRLVTRSHVIAWRESLSAKQLSGSTIRGRLAAISSLFEYLGEKNVVQYNPVDGVKRPAIEGYEGKSPALGDHQARKLLEAPQGASIGAKRDRALLAVLLYHALRREEVSKLTVKDFKQERRGVRHLKVSGKGGKTRYVPLHPGAAALVFDYLEAAGHGDDDAGGLFRPLRGKVSGSRAMTGDGIYRVVRGYSAELGFEIGAHSLRSTAATNALDNGADISKVQEWLGHSDISTTRLYDHRKTRPEDSPTFKVSY